MRALDLTEIRQVIGLTLATCFESYGVSLPSELANLMSEYARPIVLVVAGGSHPGARAGGSRLDEPFAKVPLPIEWYCPVLSSKWFVAPPPNSGFFQLINGITTHSDGKSLCVVKPSGTFQFPIADLALHGTCTAVDCTNDFRFGSDLIS